MFPTRPDNFWIKSDWANWRRRVWHGEPELRYRAPHPSGDHRLRRPEPDREISARASSPSRYAGVPLTTIAKQCGTGVTMIEKHYAGVIENWDGEQIPPERQITAAREQVGPRHAE